MMPNQLAFVFTSVSRYSLKGNDSHNRWLMLCLFNRRKGYKVKHTFSVLKYRFFLEKILCRETGNLSPDL